MEPKTLHVLIVDDDPNLLATMRDIFMVKGFKPIPVRTAAEARSQAREQTVDVALIDLHLEDMPGLELLRALKTDSPGIECILLTGHASQSSAIDAINAGAYSYFQKPCDVDQLVLSVQRAGEKRAAEAALRTSEASLQAVLQSTAEGILAVSGESKVLYANDRFVELWHVPPEIMAGQEDAALLQYVADQLVDPQSFLEKVEQLYQSDEESFDTLVFKDGRVIERHSRPLIQEAALRGRVWSFRDITARKQAEEALRRRDAQYQLLANNISDVIWILDVQTERFTYISPSVEALRGYTTEEVLANDMSAALTQASLEYIQNIIPVRLEQARQGYGGTYLDEVEQPCKDGTTVRTEATTHYHLNPENEHWEIYGVSRDISARRQAQAALRESEERFRGLYENATFGMYRTTPDGRILMTNPALLRMLGFDSFDQLAQRNLEQEGYEPDYPRSQFIATLEKDGQVIGLESAWHRQDGSMIFVRESAHLIRDVQGQTLYYDGTVEDITGQRQTEAALHESEERFRVIFEKANDAIHINNADDQILDVNPRMCELLGYSRAELLKMHVADLQAPEMRQLGNIAKNDLDKHGSAVFEGLDLHRDGRRIPVEISVGRMELPSGELYISVVRDITERKQAEAELLAARKAEKNFAERLTVLSETTTELSKTDSLDELCRQTVELGRERLDFDRLSIWFLAEDHTTVLGTFGVDVEGRIIDERQEHFTINADYPAWPVLFQGRTPLLRRTDVPLSLKGQVVGKGMHVSAGLWDGKAVIGYVNVDNLLRQRPFSDNDCEIIRLYATALGHLISLKRTEQKLRTSEERYRMLAENMTDRIWLMDLNMKTTYISPSVTSQRGYTLDELNTVPLDQQMTPESFARHVKIFTTELSNERLAQTDLPISVRIELELYKKDGTTFWSENTYSVIRDPQGQPLAILASGHDITESKKAHVALQASEKRFRALIENNTDAIVLVDPRGRILYESPAYSRIAGRDIHERLGQSSFDYVHPEDRPSLVRILNELVLSPGRIAHAAFRNQHADGSWRWFEGTATNLLGESAVQAVVINLHDITDRRQAEETLRTTERIYRQAITQTGGVPYQLNYSSDNYVFLGEGIESLTGYPPAEMNGPLFASRLRQTESYGEYKDLPHEQRVRLAEQEGIIEEWREDYLFERKDGSLVWLADHSLPVHDSEGKRQGSLGILMDITERKKAEENIRQRLAELEVLYETGLNLSRLMEPKEIGQKVLEALSEKLSWRHASVSLYRPETQRMELLVFSRPGLSAQQLQAEMRRLNRTITKPSQGFSGWVIQHGQPIRSGNVNADPRFIRTFKGIQSGLYVPMLVGDRTIGVIGVESEQAGAFSEADERLLKTLAAQASIAIENARLLAESLRQVEELGVLADVSSALRTAITRPEIILVILDQLMVGSFHADEACLVAYDPDTGTHVVEAARGKWQKNEGTRLEPGEGLRGLAAETHLPYQSNDVPGKEYLMKGETADRPEALAGVPLLVQGQFIGSLWIGRTGKKKAETPLPFIPDDMRLLGSIADISANALQRASMHALAVRHAEELLTINTMGRLLGETLDLDQIYEKLDEIVWQLLHDISHVAISLYDAGKKQITCVWFNSEDGRLDITALPPVPLAPPGGGAQSEVIHTRQPAIFNNLRERLKKSTLKMEVGTDDGGVMESGLYVPMLVHGQVVGVMQVQSYTLNRFSQAEADLLSLVANTAAVDIENARLFAETQNRLRNLAALHEIDVAISASVDIHVTLSILLEQTVSELHADAAAVLLLSPLARTLEYAAHQGFRNHQLNGVHIPLGTGLAGQAALRRQIQSVSDLQEDLTPLDGQKMAFNIYNGEGFVSHHAMPLSAKGQVQGVLEVFHRSSFQPDDEWFTFLETLSRQAAIAIDNHSLFENLQRSNTNIVLAYDATIQGWSQALELRDKETEGHARRVTERTVQLAQLVGVPDAELEHVRRGTLLHDIGKMGIPDAILLKPGPLTEAEWDIMRRHPVLAYELLSSIAYLRPALDIPHYHHEKWDGTGYPDGLKGEQIPLYARIFAIVDVYDALTNDRPYRPAWTTGQAIEYIRGESGKYFDPAIVEAFVNMLARGA